MNAGRFVLPLLIGAALGAALGVFVLAPRAGTEDATLGRHGADADRSTPRDALGPAGDASGGGTSHLTGGPAARRLLDDLQRQNEALADEKRALEARVVALTEDLDRLSPKPRDPQAFRFGVPERAPSFDKADWGKMAGTMKELTQVLNELPRVIAQGGGPSQALVARIVKYNTPLAQFAGAFGADTSDATPNGAFTHPAVIANLMRASLAATEDPLTADQELALETLGAAWLAETRRLSDEIPASAPVLRKTVAEVDAKLRFLDAAKNVLSAAQRAVLFSPESEGRLKLDLLSPVLVYVLSRPIPATDRDDMEKKLLEAMLVTAGVEKPDLEEYAWVGRQWVDDIPDVTTVLPKTSKDLSFPHVTVVQARARAQAAAAERILAMGKLDDAQAEDLRTMRTLLYPYIVGP